MIRRIPLVSNEDIKNYASDDNKLFLYLLKRLTGKNSAGAFLEISIFDTGPGLAARWLGKNDKNINIKNISLEMELSATISCFKVHATSQESAGHGDGLYFASRALRQLDAFMTLRTGRMFLWQDFSINNNNEEILFNPKFRFPDIKRLAQTGGTAYTICIPVPRPQE